jgi:uncharacterized protein YbjT (DUF2867 family)
MRVLVTGASGFIGRALVEALEREGHEVIRAARHPGAGREALAVDMAQVPDAHWWAPQLAGVQAVVNAVGILRERGTQTFEALHARAPIELFQACVRAGVPTVIQISALGADESAQSRYFRTKKAADDTLRSLPLQGAIVQPSIVYGPGGASTQLFNTLAAAPLLFFPLAGAMQFQPVHLDDVVAGVLALLREPPPQVRTVVFSGPAAMKLRDYLARLRRMLGFGGRALMLPLPEFLFRWGAAVAGLVPGSPLDRDTAGMLLAGNKGDSAPFAALLGRQPRAVEDFVPASHRDATRSQAALGLWLPVLRWALAFMWIVTAIVSLGVYPVSDSLALLARVGLHGALALTALYAAAILDLALGVLTVAAPSGWRHRVWAAQGLLIIGYTMLISVFLPEYWWHPFGPVTKNMPLLAAIGLLWSLESD